jgi:hypothetical protein
VSSVGAANKRVALGAAFSLEVEATTPRVPETPERQRVLEQDAPRDRTRTFPERLSFVLDERVSSASVVQLLFVPFVSFCEISLGAPMGAASVVEGKRGDFPHGP